MLFRNDWMWIFEWISLPPVYVKYATAMPTTVAEQNRPEAEKPRFTDIMWLIVEVPLQQSLNLTVTYFMSL